MIEPLIPIFLFSLFGNYATTGLVTSTGEIVFLLVLPIAGLLADRYSLKSFLIGGLLFFFFDGLWALAALTGLTTLVLLANFFDGVAVASDVVGRATYLRRYTSSERIASAIGLQTALINLGWIIGACFSLFAVRRFTLPWIFLGILPTNLIAVWILARFLKRESDPTGSRERLRRPFASYWQVWSQTFRRQDGLTPLAGLVVFFNLLGGFTSLLLPIYAYTEGANLQQVIFMAIVGILPETFASLLGEIADTWRAKLLPLGFAMIGLSILMLAIADSYPILISAVLMVKTVIVLLGLVVENLVTARIRPDNYGRVSSVFEGLKDLGKLIGVIGLGFALDRLGKDVVFPSLAVAAFMIGVLTSHRILQRIVSNRQELPLGNCPDRASKVNVLAARRQ